MSQPDPLRGVRVLSIEDYLILPHATKLLASLGAEVIRVESDARLFARAAGPHPKHDPGPEWWEHGASYHSGFRGKKSIVLDLTKEEGRGTFRRLVKECDVLTENTRYGVFARLGLDYEAIRAAKPDLILLSCTGFGHTGPWRSRGAVARTIDPLSGLSFVSGSEGGLPLRGNPSYMDITGGLNIALAVLAALHRRRRTGLGCRIDVAMYECGVQCVGPAVIEAQFGNIRERMGNAHPAKAPHGCYPCRGQDRWIALSIRSDSEWETLKQLMGSPTWAASSDLNSVAGRVGNRKSIDRQISAWTKQFSDKELERRLCDAGLSAGVVRHGKDVVLDEHYRARRALQVIDHDDPYLGTRAYPGYPYRVDGVRVEPPEAPRMGQHNDEVLQELLGMSPDEVADLRDRKVVSSEPARHDMVGIHAIVAIGIQHQVAVGDIVEVDPKYRERVAELANREEPGIRATEQLHERNE